MEAVISGPVGIQLVHEGDAIGNKRVTKISPDSVELADIEPSEVPTIGKTANAAATPSPERAEATEVIPARAASTPPPNPESVGYVELADGSRKSIILSGEGVNLTPEAPVTLAHAGQAQGVATAKNPQLVAEAQPAPPTPKRDRATAAVAPSQPPEAIQGAGRPEPGVGSPAKASPAPSGDGNPESPSLSPSGASIGFIEKSNGQTLGIVARADGIRLIPEEGAGKVSEAALALNEVGPLESESAPLAGVADRAPPGRSPPGEDAALSNNFKHFAENPAPQARGVPAQVRPWYLGLPGIGDGNQGDASIGLLGLPNRGVAPPIVPAPSPPSEPLPQAAPEVYLRAAKPARGIEHVGFVEWADGRRIDILSRNGEIHLIEESRPTTINQLFTPGVDSYGSGPQSRVLLPALPVIHGSPLAVIPIARKCPAALFSVIDQLAAPSAALFGPQADAGPAAPAMGTSLHFSTLATGAQMSAQDGQPAGGVGLSAGRPRFAPDRSREH